MQLQIVKKLGSHKLNDDADSAAVHKELLDLYIRDDGFETEAVVERAKDPESALHRHFQWDDTKAAHMHRLQQARNIIGSVDIRQVKDSRADDDGRIRAWVSIERTDNGGDVRRVYVPTTDAMSEAATRKQVLRKALYDATVYMRKYKGLSELDLIFEAIDIVRSDNPEEELAT